MTRTAAIDFTIWGPLVRHEELTEAFGVDPSRAFRVGELPGRAVKDKAGWEWKSGWGEPEDLFRELLELFGQHVSAIQRCVAEGAAVKLRIYQSVDGVIAHDEQEAEAQGYYVHADPFEPFFSVDNIYLTLSADLIQFLAKVEATFDECVAVGSEEEESQ